MVAQGEAGFGDEDRLPWLETVEEEYAEGLPVLRMILFVVVGLAVLSALIYAIYWFQDARGPHGKGALITAPAGPYKVKPDSPGGMKVEGEGDTAFATSEGQTDGNAQIDLKAVPETPVTVATPAPAKPDAVGTLVQLGSLGSAAEANATWTRMSKRFGYLAPLTKSIEVATVNGHTVYRLRVDAGSADAAAELCGKLKVAGEACFIP